MAARKLSLPEKVHAWEKMLVHPKSGESLLSWLMRQSWAFGITPKRLIQSEKEYWLLKENISLSLRQESFMTLDVLPVPDAWDNVLRQRGLNIGINELRLDISKWLDPTKLTEVTKYELQNYYHYSLRYCPLCWKDENSRYFRNFWRLPFLIVCLEHGIELKESCSSCGETLFDDKRYRLSSAIVLQNFREDWMTCCKHCNHSLLEEVVEEKPELAILQKHIIYTLLTDSYWATPKGYLIFWHTYQTTIKKQKPDSAEAYLKFMDAILKKPHLIHDSNKYSQELLAETERRLQIVTLYLSGTSAKKLSERFGPTEFSIRAFAKDLLNGKPADEIIKRQYGYIGKLGLELAQAEMKKFKAKHGRLPRSREKEMASIHGAIYEQEWIAFGVGKWNDLLIRTFGEVNIESGFYTGEQGLQRAIDELRTFKAKYGRLPKTDDKEMSGIITAINYREFASFGIRKWNDLLRRVFGRVNIEMGIYKGEQGLQRAVSELWAFKESNGRLPKSGDKEMSGIRGAIKREEWVPYGFEKWNDLLRKTFGIVNKKGKNLEK